MKVPLLVVDTWYLVRACFILTVTNGGESVEVKPKTPKPTPIHPRFPDVRTAILEELCDDPQVPEGSKVLQALPAGTSDIDGDCAMVPALQGQEALFGPEGCGGRCQGESTARIAF